VSGQPDRLHGYDTEAEKAHPLDIVLPVPVEGADPFRYIREISIELLGDDLHLGSLCRDVTGRRRTA
jgi:hypothetical protein